MQNAVFQEIKGVERGISPLLPSVDPPPALRSEGDPCLNPPRNMQGCGSAATVRNRRQREAVAHGGIPLCPSRAVMARSGSKGERRGTRQPIGMKERECVPGHWSVCEAPPRRQHFPEWRTDGARSVCRRESLGTGSAAIVSHGGRC